MKSEPPPTPVKNDVPTRPPVDVKMECDVAAPPKPPAADREVKVKAGVSVMEGMRGVHVNRMFYYYNMYYILYVILISTCTCMCITSTKLFTACIRTVACPCTFPCTCTL